MQTLVFNIKVFFTKKVSQPNQLFFKKLSQQMTTSPPQLFKIILTELKISPWVLRWSSKNARGTSPFASPAPTLVTFAGNCIRETAQGHWAACLLQKEKRVLPSMHPPPADSCCSSVLEHPSTLHPQTFNKRDYQALQPVKEGKKIWWQGAAILV